MCENESYLTLSQPEHFTRHALHAKEDCAIYRVRGLGCVSVEHAMQEANYALALADNGVAPESKSWLSLVAVGDLEAAAYPANR